MRALLVLVLLVAGPAIAAVLQPDDKGNSPVVCEEGRIREKVVDLEGSYLYHIRETCRWYATWNLHELRVDSWFYQRFESNPPNNQDSVASLRMESHKITAPNGTSSLRRTYVLETEGARATMLYQEGEHSNTLTECHLAVEAERPYGRTRYSRGPLPACWPEERWRDHVGLP